MSKFVDILGTEIEVGDIVAIGQRSGNGGSLNAAIVLEKIVDDEAYNDYDRYKIRVLGSNLNRFTKEFTVNSRHGDTYPDRVIVITDSVPDELDEVLGEALQKYNEKKK